MRGVRRPAGAGRSGRPGRRDGERLRKATWPVRRYCWRVNSGRRLQRTSRTSISFPWSLFITTRATQARASLFFHAHDPAGTRDLLHVLHDGVEDREGLSLQALGPRVLVSEVFVGHRVVAAPGAADQLVVVVVVRVPAPAVAEGARRRAKAVVDVHVVARALAVGLVIDPLAGVAGIVEPHDAPAVLGAVAPLARILAGEIAGIGGDAHPVRHALLQLAPVVVGDHRADDGGAVVTDGILHHRPGHVGAAGLDGPPAGIGADRLAGQHTLHGGRALVDEIAAFLLHHARPAATGGHDKREGSGCNNADRGFHRSISPCRLDMPATIWAMRSG